MYSVFREKRHFFRVLNSTYNHKCPTGLQQERLGEGRKSTQCSNCFISPGHRGEAYKALEWRGQWRPSFASNAYRHRCSAMPCSAFRVHNSKKVAFSGQFAVRTVHNSILLAHAPESPTLRSHTGPPACRSPRLQIASPTNPRPQSALRGPLGARRTAKRFLYQRAPL